jgi:hypothetical protein
VWASIGVTIHAAASTHQSMRRMGWLSLSAPWLLISTACTAVLDGGSAAGPGGGSSSNSGSGGTVSASGGSASGGAPNASDCTQTNAPVLHARLLTPSQYDHSVLDLLKVDGHPARDFGGGVAARLDDVAVERRANAAADIAAQAVSTISAWSPCVPPAVDATTCEAQLIDKLGAAAYRRPLAADERSQLKQLFDAGVTEKDFATGLDWLLTGLLQTPDFLYQFAKPAAGENAGQVVPLSAYELASRLSLFMWDGPPDDALYAAAGAGKLNDAAGLATELERLVSDARFARGTESYYSDWLGLKGFKEVARDDAALTSDLITTLESSLLMSATSLYASAAPNIESLFSGESYYLNDKLRTFYGLTGGGPMLESVALPNEARRGIVTHPGLMTLLARPNASNPIARGLFVQRTLLCNEIPPPPQGVVIPQLPPAMPGLPTRARLEQHTQEPLCASCHDQIDPPGFALENYDAVGRFRTQDAGLPVDTSGSMQSGGDTGGAFATGGEFLDRLAKSSDVKRCFAKHYLGFAVARDLAPEDTCALSRLADDFAKSGDLKQLVVAVAKSDAFRLRATEAPGAQP